MKFEANLRWWVDWLGQLTENDPTTLTQKRAVFPAFSSREVTLGQMRKIGIHFIIYQTTVICSASHTKPNRCLIFSFVQNVLGREDGLSNVLVNANLEIEVKQQIKLKMKFTSTIGGAAVPQCLHTSRYWLAVKVILQM